MIKNENLSVKTGEVTFEWHEDADLLSIHFGTSEAGASMTVQGQHGFKFRINPKTQEIIGITIVDAMKKITEGKK